MTSLRADVQGVGLAAASLGLVLHEAELVSSGRTGIYRVIVEADRSFEGIPAGTSVQAARVERQTDSLTPPPEVHRLLRALHEAGARVAAPRHREIVSTAHGYVGFWEWMDRTRVSARDWGALTGRLHRAGASVPRSRPYHPARVFESRIRRARELTSTPGHPLFGEQRLVDAFECALDEAVTEALNAATACETTLVHGDNQPANVMRGCTGLVLNDFERIATGPPALDLAALVLGIQHYGYPTRAAEDFRHGYGPSAPTLEAARPYARIRELSGAVIAMIEADTSPQMEREMRVRAVCVTHPGEGRPWTYIGNSHGIGLISPNQSSGDGSPVIQTGREPE